jgi:hypothetical protein
MLANRNMRTGLKAFDILNKAVLLKTFWTLATNKAECIGRYMCSKVQRGACLVDCGTLLSK